MSEIRTQFNKSTEGFITFGRNNDVDTQTEVEGIDTNRLRGIKRAQTIIDEGCINTEYASAITLVEDYFAVNDLEIDPIRIVRSTTFDKALAAASAKGVDDKRDYLGEHMFGRAVVIDDSVLSEQYGEKYIIGMALHEAAHSALGTHFIRTAIAKPLGKHVCRSFEFGGLSKVDLRRNGLADSLFLNKFWDEAFADLTRVKGLHALGMGPDKSSPIYLRYDPKTNRLDNSRGKSSWGQSEGWFPTEYALATTGLTHSLSPLFFPPNYAAYALALLDRERSGIYEDFKASSKVPARQASAIQKIESISSGLYRRLGSLPYSHKAFSQGLVEVQVIVAANRMVEKALAS